MHGNIRTAQQRATNITPETGRRLPDTGTKPRPKTGTEFADQCDKNIGKDAGSHLQFLTSYPRSTCYRYASGNVPPVDFMAQLFASAEGAAFFDWFMSDNNSDWWQERERHRRMGEAADKAG